MDKNQNSFPHPKAKRKVLNTRGSRLISLSARSVRKNSNKK
jgi:hypothetical protein